MPASGSDHSAGLMPGCICRPVQGDNYDCLDYVARCFHHRQLYVLREVLKDNYARMEKTLKDEARLRLIAAALSGAAFPQDPRDMPGAGVGSLVERAILIADATIRRITETA